jgi:hypothetical protein
VGARGRAGGQGPRRIRATAGRFAGQTIALGQNTHELVTRWLSALDFRSRQSHRHDRRASSHTIRRQLDRLEEEGVEIVRELPRIRPTISLSAWRARSDDRTLAAMMSSVLFATAEIVPQLMRSRVRA